VMRNLLPTTNNVSPKEPHINIVATSSLYHSDSIFPEEQVHSVFRTTCHSYPPSLRQNIKKMNCLQVMISFIPTVLIALFEEVSLEAPSTPFTKAKQSSPEVKTEASKRGPRKATGIAFAVVLHDEPYTVRPAPKRKLLSHPLIKPCEDAV